MQIDDFQKLLNTYLEESGMSKNKLAIKSGVSQSQISDWSNGKGVRFTEKAKRVVSFIENDRRSSQNKLPEKIETAVKSLLNGDNSRVEALEKFLKSLILILNDS